MEVVRQSSPDRGASIIAEHHSITHGSTFKKKTAENDRFCRVRNAVLKSQAIFPQAHWSKCSSICDTPCGSKESPVYREICTGGGWGKTGKRASQRAISTGSRWARQGGLSGANLVFHRLCGREGVLLTTARLLFNPMSRTRVEI
jgi:hypothetical protein